MHESRRARRRTPARAAAQVVTVQNCTDGERGTAPYVPMTTLAGQPDVIEAIAAPVVASSARTDAYECYNWAKAQSGVDPGAPPPPAQPGQRARGAVGGAPRGAALGAAVGAIAGDAGKGAAAGAVVGGVHGRRRSMAAQQAQQQATRSAYDRAFAACMEGRGYTVR